MTKQQLSRRERIRADTLEAIQTAARRQLIEGGPTAITLRAIAREVGLSAPALYRYYPNLNAIVTALVATLYDEVSDTIEHARDAVTPADPLTQLPAMAQAFRRWSIGHPREFSLVFGTPIPGMSSFDAQDDPVVVAGSRFGGVFLEALARLSGRAQPTQLAPISHPGFMPSLVPPLTILATDLPEELVHFFLAAWTHLYGLVAMEVFGQLRWAVSEAGPLFDLEVASLLRPFESKLPD